MRHPLPLAFLSLLLVHCAASGYEKARKADTADAYRDFVRASPRDPAVGIARERLAELEFEKARRLQTPLALKRFLDEFEGSPRRSDAQVLLEGLRFEAALQRNSSVGWNDFLRDHPQGVHAGDARSKLDEADYRDAREAGTAKAMRDYLGKHPDSKNRVEGEKLLDDRLFAEARPKGPRAVMEYLDTAAAGTHRDEARAELKTREVLARAAVGDFEAAYREAELIPEPDKRKATLEKVGEAELEWASAQLDPMALETLAKSREGVAVEARARAKALSSDKKGGAALKELAARLEPTRYSRPEDELIKVLEASDPRERWLAAEELGRIGARRAIDPLLNQVAGSRFVRVRVKAFDALRAIFSALPADTVEVEVRQRAEGLRKVAQGQELQIKLAVLDELLGDDKAAAEGYARSLRTNGNDDTFVLRRMAQVRIRRKEAFSTAVAARELATAVLAMIEQRAEQQAGLNAALYSRTLCGARDDARDAAALLKGLPPATASDFPEDLLAFGQRADEAVRVSAAKLADVEAEARVKDRSFKGCDDEGDSKARLADGEEDRLKAVAELSAKKDARVKPALERTARLDPAMRVRQAAKAALGAPAAEARAK